MNRLKQIASKFSNELRVYRLVLKDKRTPKLAKLLPGLAVGYTIMPFDLIPDFIPVIGHLDDMIIVPILVIIALKIIPEDIISEYRLKLLEKEQLRNKV